MANSQDLWFGLDPGDAAPSAAARTLAFVALSLTMLGTYYGYEAVGPVAALLSRDLGFSNLQLGSLNAIYSLPNIILVLLGGALVDRHGARAVALITTFICFAGAVLTATATTFAVMAVGRLLFGVGGETLFVAVLVALSQWFTARSLALAVAMTMSLARLGSYLADRSPSFAHSLYERGWQPPLWLAAGFSALALLAIIVYCFVERRERIRGTLVTPDRTEPLRWHSLATFGRQYWYLVGLCVTFYSAILTFRSTFAIKYFQQEYGLSLESASRLNSYVFLTALLTTPLFGAWVDRTGRSVGLLRAGSLALPASFLLLWVGRAPLWVPTALLGASFSLVPAVLWPAVAHRVGPLQRGTAYGLMAMLQNLGMTLANLIAGVISDGGRSQHPYGPMLMFFTTLGIASALCALGLREDRMGRSEPRARYFSDTDAPPAAREIAHTRRVPSAR